MHETQQDCNLAEGCASLTTISKICEVEGRVGASLKYICAR